MSDERQRPELSRYNFLRLGGGTILGLAVDEAIRQLRGERWLTEVILEPDEIGNLENSGLSEWVPIYQWGQRLKQAFGATIFPELISMLESVALDQITPPYKSYGSEEIIQVLRSENWGWNQHQAQTDAAANIDRLLASPDFDADARLLVLDQQKNA